jgi:hypothetical protein
MAPAVCKLNPSCVVGDMRQVAANTQSGFCYVGLPIGSLLSPIRLSPTIQDVLECVLVG